MQEHWKLAAHLSNHVAVHVLEDLIETKLAETLHGVADEGGGPSLTQGSDALLLKGYPEALEDASIFGWIYLDTALDEIEGHHCCVGDTTGQDTTKAAQGKVLWTAKLAAVLWNGNGDIKCDAWVNYFVRSFLVINGNISAKCVLECLTLQE